MGRSIRQRTFKFNQKSVIEGNKDRHKSKQQEILDKMKETTKSNHLKSVETSIVPSSKNKETSIDYKSESRKLRTRVGKLEDSLKSHKGKIQDLSGDIARQKTIISDKDGIINSLNNQLSDSKDIVNEKDREIKRLKDLLNEGYDRVVEPLNSEIRSLKFNLNKHYTANGRSYKAIALGYESKLSERKTKIFELSHDLEVLTEDKEILESKLASYEESYSRPNHLIHLLIKNFKISNIDSYWQLEQLMNLYITAKESTYKEVFSSDEVEDSQQFIYGTVQWVDDYLLFRELNGGLHAINDEDASTLPVGVPTRGTLNDDNSISINGYFNVQSNRVVRRRTKKIKKDSGVKSSFDAQLKGIRIKIGIVGGGAKPHYNSLVKENYIVEFLDPFEHKTNSVERFVNSVDLALFFYDSIPHSILDIAEDNENVVILQDGYNSQSIRALIHARNYQKCT